MNKIEAMKNRSDVTYHKEFGWDADLNENNCSVETWAFLRRPDSERMLDYEKWFALYEQRRSTDIKEDDKLPF